MVKKRSRSLGSEIQPPRHLHIHTLSVDLDQRYLIKQFKR